MEWGKCNNKYQKAGRQKNGAQKLYCRVCKKYRQVGYKYNAYRKDINTMISGLVKESVGILGISRLLKIASDTVLKPNLMRRIPRRDCPFGVQLTRRISDLLSAMSS